MIVEFMNSNTVENYRYYRLEQAISCRHVVTIVIATASLDFSDVCRILLGLAALCWMVASRSLFSTNWRTSSNPCRWHPTPNPAHQIVATTVARLNDV